MKNNLRSMKPSREAWELGPLEPCGRSRDLRVLLKLHLITSSHHPTMSPSKYVQESREFPGKVTPHCSQISAQPSWNAESISKACPLFTHISSWPLPPWAEFHHPSCMTFLDSNSLLPGLLASIQCPSIQSSGHSTHIAVRVSFRNVN